MTQPFAMLVSIAVEAATAAALIVALGWGNAVRAAASAALGTVLTHWFAWHWSPVLMTAIGAVPGFIAAEAAVTIVEAVVYRLVVPLGFGRALVLSLAANGSSAALGVLLAALKILPPA